MRVRNLAHLIRAARFFVSVNELGRSDRDCTVNHLFGVATGSESARGTQLAVYSGGSPCKIVHKWK